MNERIQELAGQAWNMVEDTNKPLLFAEKFAELIVRECLEWCDAHATIDGSAQQVRNSIKNHFGVE